MLWAGAGQLEFRRGVFLFSSLEVTFEHAFDVLSIFPDSCLLSQKN